VRDSGRVGFVQVLGARTGISFSLKPAKRSEPPQARPSSDPSPTSRPLSTASPITTRPPPSPPTGRGSRQNYRRPKTRGLFGPKNSRFAGENSRFDRKNSQFAKASSLVLIPFMQFLCWPGAIPAPSSVRRGAPRMLRLPCDAARHSGLSCVQVCGVLAALETSPGASTNYWRKSEPVLPYYPVAKSEKLAPDASRRAKENITGARKVGAVSPFETKLRQWARELSFQ
jgi:hypothetical protein